MECAIGTWDIIMIWEKGCCVLGIMSFVIQIDRTMDALQ